MAGFWATLGRYFIRKPPVPTEPRAAIVEELRAACAFLAQSSTYPYARARMGLKVQQLMENEAFSQALNICKWEGFAAILSDLLLVLEAKLREDGLQIETKQWTALYAAVLASESIPSHRADQGWADVSAAFATRMAEAQKLHAMSLRDITQHSAQVILSHLPVTPDIRQADAYLIENNLEFRFIDYVVRLWPRLQRLGFAQELQKPI